MIFSVVLGICVGINAHFELCHHAQQTGLFTMSPKRGTLLLFVACAALANSLSMMPGNGPDFKDMAKRLMRKCHDKGCPVPKMLLLRTVFNNSDSPAKDRSSGQSDTLLSTFMNILDSFSPAKESLSRVPLDDSDKTMMWNCSNLSKMIKLIRNSSEASACYVHAFMAPLSWAALTTQSDNNMDSDDYDTLLWAARSAVQGMPATRMKLPIEPPPERVKMILKMLLELYEFTSEAQRMKVVRWAKQQITENYFNCTMRPPSDSRLKLMQRCKPSLKWLNMEALIMIGPYLSYLEPSDVDSSPKEKLCEFFYSAKFKSALKMVVRMNPSLAKRFIERFQGCFSGRKDFAEHVDKLGTLACHYWAVPDLSPELSKKLLSELNNCDDLGNPRIKMLKKRLIKAVMSNSNTTEVLPTLGSSVTLLSPTHLPPMSVDDLKNLGSSVQWTKDQLRKLVKKQLGDMKCKKLSGEELMALKSVAAGLPSCVLKHVKAQEILHDEEALRNISKRMNKGQLKAMLQGLRMDVDPLELVQKLAGPLLRKVSISSLSKANITSLDQLGDKTWSRPQAAYLAKKMYDLKQLQYGYRRLRSVLQGITCKMIEKVADRDVQDMAQALTETPRWLSKVQAGCAARKLFGTLEKKRADYFKNITGKEMDDIPTFLFVHLNPQKVKDLPDSACPVFIDKMEVADLSLLPHRAPSRPALTRRALLCLANGTDLSRLTTDDVSRLGSLLCELQPTQLRLLAPDVLASSLQAMASCQHIPQRHRADLIQLVTQTFGNSSDWSAEMMEKLGPLILLDDNATSALPNKPWMKDVLYFLKSCLSRSSDALRKKIFSLITNAALETSSANSNSTGNGTDDSNGSSGSINGTNSNVTDISSSSNSSTVSAKVPTVELIEELGKGNVYWTPAELDRMSTQTFLATVETLGIISDYSADQLAVLSKKATKALGPASNMTESVVMQLGCLIQGFSNTDLEKLPLSLDALEDIAQCGWSESQMEPLWKGVAKYNNLTAQQLGAVEMVALSRFICGLNAREIGQLSMDAFKDAVGSMDGVQYSFQVAQQLKRLAVSAFGDPRTWTEARAADLGNIVAGLDANELFSLDPSVMPFLSESCISLIPPSNFAGLSGAQLEALGPDNAAMVTSEQRAAMTDKQLAALERAMTGSRDQKQTPEGSGAPSLSVEGISAFMKPLLFLLTGFLLL
ncbi:otoancorin isoform X2 [Chelmon rostratus]|uniref:otoancorin isoform X2 n=1 Tax=Chelmon rostratus TaxID=109905 RepID=UPI001BECFC01|nr:otoancorin isoform X2 [Chelmon rostratus]